MDLIVQIVLVKMMNSEIKAIEVTVFLIECLKLFFFKPKRSVGVDAQGAEGYYGGRETLNWSFSVQST